MTTNSKDKEELVKEWLQWKEFETEQFKKRNLSDSNAEDLYNLHKSAKQIVHIAHS